MSADSHSAPAEALKPPEPRLWHKRIARRAAKLFIDANQFFAERLKKPRELREPDDDDLDDFADDIAGGLAYSFPDAVLSPWAQVGLSATFLAGEMWSLSKPAGEAQRALPAANGAAGVHAAATTTTPTEMAAPPPSSPPPETEPETQQRPASEMDGGNGSG